MTAPKFATTRPAALTGTIGQGGFNRIHDVALVQALLGAKRDRSSRPYLRDHVTGQYDKFTAEALLRFRMDQRDASIKRPFNRSGPLLNKLAQGQALAVPEGTAIPYQIKTLAEPGEIEGPIAGLLSAERKVALKEVMKEFISDWGIAFNVEIKPATDNLPPRSIPVTLFESRPLVAHFTPRNLTVRLPRGLSVVPSNAQFRAKAKVLYEMGEDDLKARCAQAFGFKDPADVKIQNGLKDDLACVVRTDLEGVEALTQFFLAEFRKAGLKLAVRFVENYLAAKATPIELGLEQSPEFDLGRVGAADNVERFKQQNLISPDPSNPAFSAIDDISKKPDVAVTQFQDHWKADINFGAAGMERFFEAGVSKLGATVSAFLATGRSSVTSTGDFLLQREGDRILVTGAITHEWRDVDGYNFNVGKLFYEESQVLERHQKAKPFEWTVRWGEGISGELRIDNAFSPNATRRWIKFETNPISM